MGRRLELHAIFTSLLDPPNVYFQPPETIVMQYPCIVYQRDSAHTAFADGIPYWIVRRYQVTVIDRNPDSDILDKVAALPKCLFNNHFVANNLNHDVYNLYY